MSALSQKLKGEWNALRNWRLLSVFSLLACPAICIWISWINSQTIRTIVITGETHYIGLAIPAMLNTQAHEEIAKKAANAIFARMPVEVPEKQPDPMNVVRIPTSFPFREDLLRVTNTELQMQIKKNWEDNAEVFRQQNVTQYFVPSRQITEQIVDNDLITMTVDGDLFTNSTVPGGRPRLDTAATRVTMNLRLNTKFPQKYEFVVVGFTTEKLK